MLNLDYKAVIAAAIVGSIAVWAAKNAAIKTVETVAHKVDPLNKDNVINEYFDKFYRMVSDGPDSLGEDIYDLTH